jgi:hypothetical protein
MERFMEVSPDTAGYEGLRHQAGSKVMSRAIKGIFTVLLGPIVVGYTVELIKGTPPGKIAGVLWDLLRAAISPINAWLSSPVHWTHGGVALALVVAFIALLVLGRWLKARLSRAPEIAADFDPTRVQLAALALMLSEYGTPQNLEQMQERLKIVTDKRGGTAYLEQQIEGLERANAVRPVDLMGTTHYELTLQGRDWLLDHIKTAEEEKKSAKSAS